MAPNIPSDIKFQALHEHYQDTFFNITESIKLRDKLTILVFLILVFLVLYTFWPIDAATAFSQMVGQKTGISASIDQALLSSIIWLALLISLIRYLQIVVYIERQYAYIHRLEDELSKSCDNDVLFTRESKSYLKNYPIFSNWICMLYTIIFPIILIIVVIFKIINEWVISPYSFSLPLVLNTVLAAGILISLILYMLFMYKQE